MSHKFFDEREDQSEVKARIVSKYFASWANIIIPTAKNHPGKIAYIDLYAGPGRYKDGAASTPLMVLETAIATPKIADMLVTIFNEGDNDNADTLRNEIDKFPNIDHLKHKPKIYQSVVDDELADLLSKTNMVPSLTFIDPFGYKGLSRKIINAVIKNWGCDCVFFFNYNRINAGITNPSVGNHMEALFGPDRLSSLQNSVKGVSPSSRRALVLEAMCQTIKDMGPKFVLPFTFMNANGTRTSHDLIFVSKHVLGYKVMKGIMASESSTEDEGVPSFRYCPAEADAPLLFSLARPIEGLADELCKTFAGKTLSMQQIFDAHHVDTPYIERNYKEALRRLEEAGRISAYPPAAERRISKGVRTFADTVKVTFL